MNEQQTKDTLNTPMEKLRFAIARVEAYRAMPIIEAIKCGVGWAAAERDAWKAAFEWRDDIEFATVDGTYAEGMRLIREKLQS